METPGRPTRAAARAALTFALVRLAIPGGLSAQTDFYGLDRDRPLRVEDAYAAKRWAFELQGSPLSLEREREGALVWAPSIELKHGLLPGLELSVGTSVERRSEDGESDTTTGDIELSTLVNLWVEGPSLPAAAIRVTGHLPTDGDGRTAVEVRGNLTRGITGPIRVHLNGGLSFGDGREEDGWVGGALDYVLPFHHVLILVETWVSRADGEEDRSHSGVGARLQVGPTLSLDVGVGRDWSGEHRRSWSLELGATREFGIRALMP